MAGRVISLTAARRKLARVKTRDGPADREKSGCAMIAARILGASPMFSPINSPGGRKAQIFKLRHYPACVQLKG
jgi:hypothetical protein